MIVTSMNRPLMSSLLIPNAASTGRCWNAPMPDRQQPQPSSPSLNFTQLLELDSGERRGGSVPLVSGNVGAASPVDG